MMFSKYFSEKYFIFLEIVKSDCKKMFTQDELAEILEVSKPTINKVMNGKIIRVDILEQIAGLCCYNLDISLTLRK